MYSPYLIDLFENPIHQGLTEGSPTLSASNPVCGDQITLSIQIHNGNFQEIRHHSQGCPPAIAVGELIARALQNAPTDSDWPTQIATDLEKLQPLPSNKLHALALAKSLIKQLRTHID